MVATITITSVDTLVHITRADPVLRACRQLRPPLRLGVQIHNLDLDLGVDLEALVVIVVVAIAAVCTMR
jgi:hypothetical protein